MKLTDYRVEENAVYLFTDTALQLRVQSVGDEILRLCCTNRAFCERESELVVTPPDALAPTVQDMAHKRAQQPRFYVSLRVVCKIMIR